MNLWNVPDLRIIGRTKHRDLGNEDEDYEGDELPHRFHYHYVDEGT